ncbi:coproporphyrinogen III oxidase [Micrococcales bacterium 31B]|nr:coproporphyrinogen III oxidase [Micrococcales bacterium 31B]
MQAQVTQLLATPRGVNPEFEVPAPSAYPFSVYLHVPFCAVRCGYCDFNTYTAAELGGGGSRLEYAAHAVAEMRLAAGHVGAGRSGGPVAPASTVFFGGGTPTLLPAADLVTMLEGVRTHFGLAAGAEVTTEANPDSVDAEYLEALARGGFTRVSLGMQSAVPHVLATLERTHDPRRVAEAVRQAKALGMQVSLDLIYGTPGESLDDWRASLREVIDLEPDHVSAYALVVEPGTRLARQVRQGVISLPDLDDQAAKYELADALLGEAGYDWYEISNWSRGESTRCRHNLAYWRNVQWWGVGPGAHSHVGGSRFWNVKHPSTYAQALAQGTLPIADGEVLDAEAQHLERVLLGIRLREGLDALVLSSAGRQRLAVHVADGCVDGRALLAGRVVLTGRGRLLADAIVRDIV